MRTTVRKFKETTEIKTNIIKRFKSHKYFPLTVLLAVLLATACFHIWLRVRVMDLVKEISHLKTENKLLVDNKKKLYSDLAALKTSSRIEKYATDTLGLEIVKAENLLTLDKENSQAETPGNYELFVNAVDRMTDFFPVIEETKANAEGIEDIRIDTADNGWDIE